MLLQSVQGDMLESSDIYETVRSEVRRAISEIQNDLESVSFMISWFVFANFESAALFDLTNGDWYVMPLFNWKHSLSLTNNFNVINVKKGIEKRLHKTLTSHYSLLSLL